MKIKVEGTCQFSLPTCYWFLEKDRVVNQHSKSPGRTLGVFVCLFVFLFTYGWGYCIFKVCIHVGLLSCLPISEQIRDGPAILFSSGYQPGGFCPPATFINVFRHFWLLHLGVGMCYCYLMGRGQGFC